ncbi:MAG: hypothetical protein IJS32_02360, partial [Kiritimatiellae bacterium]|nr:hypothetical protein [Kiritimatiellia bacterium]
RWTARRPVAGARLARTAAGLAAVAAVPVLILFGGGRFHAIRTDAMALMHRFILEFRPLLADAKGAGAVAKTLFGAFGVLPVAWAAAFGAAGRGKPTPERLALLASATMAAAFAGLALWQIRWTSMAGVPGLFPALLLLSQRPKGRPLAARAVALAVCVPLLACAALHARDAWLGIRKVAEGTEDNAVMFYAVESRIRAQRLAERAEENGGELRLCAPISHGPVFAWHRAGKVLGSLYWENLEGVAAFYRAGFDMTPEAETAEEIFRERGITHLLASASDRLPDIVEGDVPPLGRRLTEGKDLPKWLARDEELEKALDLHFILAVPPLDGERARLAPLRRHEKMLAYRILPDAEGTRP